MQLVDATRSKHLQTKSTHWRNITAGQKLLFSGALQSFKTHPPPFLGQFCQQLTWSAYNPCELLAQQSLNTSSHSITAFGLRFMKEDNLLPWKGYLRGHAFPRGVALNPIISYWENLSTFLVIKISLPHLPPPPSKHWALNMPGKLFTTISPKYHWDRRKENVFSPSIYLRWISSCVFTVKESRLSINWDV